MFQHLIDELNKIVGSDWKMTCYTDELVKLQLPNESFIEHFTNLVKERYPWTCLDIEIIKPTIIKPRFIVFRPKPNRPDPKLKAISYQATKIIIQNHGYHDDYYYLESFVFDDGSVWDRARGKWKLIYQPEVEEEND